MWSTPSTTSCAAREPSTSQRGECRARALPSPERRRAGQWQYCTATGLVLHHADRHGPRAGRRATLASPCEFVGWQSAQSQTGVGEEPSTHARSVIDPDGRGAHAPNDSGHTGCQVSVGVARLRAMPRRQLSARCIGRQRTQIAMPKSVYECAYSAAIPRVAIFNSVHR